MQNEDKKIKTTIRSNTRLAAIKALEAIREKKEVLAKWLTLEVGKPFSEGIGEVGGSADIFEWNAEETKRI